MSKPLRILVNVSNGAAPEAMQISDCVEEVVQEHQSPLDGFDASIKTIARIAAPLATEGDHSTVSEMLIVASVASVEAYFRDMLSRLASVCPLVSERIKGHEITLGAARSYPPHMLALASLERTSFSTKTVIEKELARYVGWEPRSDPDTKAAIEAFERACACRHSIVHWRGALDSATMRDLGLNDVHMRRYTLVADFALVQRVMAACSHLVHLINGRVLNLTLQRWLSTGYLELDEALRDEELSKLTSLVGVFESRSVELPMTSGMVWDVLVKDQR